MVNATAVQRFMFRLGMIAILVGGCGEGGGSPNERRFIVVQGSNDMLTNRTSDPTSPDYPFWLQTDQFYFVGVSWDDTLRLVTWPDQAVVPGSWVEDLQPTGHRILRFEPTEPLEERWYALQVRFNPAWRLGFLAPAHTDPESPWTSIRSRVGSQPIVVLSGTPRDPRFPDQPEGTFVLSPSELVEFDADVDVIEHIEYRIDGQTARCWGAGRHIVGPSQDLPFSNIEVACDPAEVGSEIYFGLRDTFRSRSGPFYARDGLSPPTWWFIAGDGPPNEPQDALFAVRPAMDGVAP